MPNKSLIFLLGTMVYAVLAILALVFYCERTAFLDISLHLFYIIKEGDFAIQNNRFGAAVTQVFPLISSKLGLDLKLIMQLYSLAFVIYYYSVFAICCKVFKSYRFGLIMLLLSTLMVTDTFYWIQSELPQGLAFFVLFFGFIDYLTLNEAHKKRWFVLPILGFSIVTLAFFHPLIIFPFAFIIAFLLLHDKAHWKLYIGTLASILFVLLIKSRFFKTAYDTAATGGGLSNLIDLFPNYFSLPSNTYFLSYAIQDYYFLVLGLVLVLFCYAKRMMLTKLFLVISFFFGYILIVNVTFPSSQDQFYMENLYLPLSLFVGIPIVFDVSKFLHKNVFIALIFVAVSIRVVHIGLNHKTYTERVDYLNTYLEQTVTLDQKKQVIQKDVLPMDTLLMTWATPYEFWLLSTINTGQTRSIMVTNNLNHLVWMKNMNDKFLTKWGAFNYSDLPPKYFNFSDTTYYNFIKE